MQESLTGPRRWRNRASICISTAKKSRGLGARLGHLTAVGHTVEEAAARVTRARERLRGA